MKNLEWFSTLNKPILSPPDWLFAPVWTILYIMIFLSLIFYTKSGQYKYKKLGFIFFIIQLTLNLIWSPIFFNFQNISVGLIIIILMWLFILLTMICFWRHSKISALLLVPYFLWVSFATYLNWGYFILN